MSVLETKPAAAVSVIECDLNVDFAPPVGYKEPVMPSKISAADDEDEEPYESSMMPVQKIFELEMEQHVL